MQFGTLIYRSPPGLFDRSSSLCFGSYVQSPGWMAAIISGTLPEPHCPAFLNLEEGFSLLS
jgi:hypothetical protein